MAHSSRHFMFVSYQFSLKNTQFIFGLLVRHHVWELCKTTGKWDYNTFWTGEKQLYVVFEFTYIILYILYNLKSFVFERFWDLNIGPETKYLDCGSLLMFSASSSKLLDYTVKYVTSVSWCVILNSTHIQLFFQLTQYRHIPCSCKSIFK
jgi:hypothetical protein